MLLLWTTSPREACSLCGRAMSGSASPSPGGKWWWEGTVARCSVAQLGGGIARSRCDVAKGFGVDHLGCVVAQFGCG
jgi:hypothetical protein